jgi:4-hydroxy 2-oxovalerate aldolase
MKPILLDCTLRDGGNQNNWNFTADDVRAIVSTLDSAGVDVIEVGYRGGSGSRDSSRSGPSAHSSPTYLTDLPEVRHALLAVMVVPTVCPVTQLQDLPDSPIGMVRIAAYPWDMGAVPRYIAAVHELGLLASVNIMAVSYASRAQLVDIANLIRAEQPDAVYVADSFGSLTPDDIRSRIALLAQELASPIGIHAHNNIGLATANAIAALDSGATWLDASLCAMARGAGNLATEQAAAFLTAWPKYETDVDVPLICRAADYVNDYVLPHPMLVRRPEIAAGLNDHHYYFQERIDRAADSLGHDAWRIGQLVGAIRPRKVHDDVVESACRQLKGTNSA